MIVVAAAIVRDGLLLAQQRAYPSQSAGRWELPGGRVEPGETEPGALRRECREELGVDVTVGDRVGPDIELGHRGYLRTYAAVLAAGQPEPRVLEHAALCWLPAPDLHTLDWLEADVHLLPHLRALLGPGGA